MESIDRCNEYRAPKEQTRYITITAKTRTTARKAHLEKQQLLCSRCGKTWTPQDALLRAGLLPKRCPHCRSSLWNQPRQRRRSK